MAACYDALSAKRVESAGFAATFMSGFGVAATRLGLPDTGLIYYGEMLNQGRNICQAVSIPVLGDGDTGFGNEMNVKRTADRGRDARLVPQGPRIQNGRPDRKRPNEEKHRPKSIMKIWLRALYRGFTGKIQVWDRRIDFQILLEN